MSNAKKQEVFYRVEHELNHDWRWYNEWTFLKSLRDARAVITLHRKHGEKRRMRIVRSSEQVVFESGGKP